jgi:hypothetical protein
MSLRLEAGLRAVTAQRASQLIEPRYVDRGKG